MTKQLLLFSCASTLILCNTVRASISVASVVRSATVQVHTNSLQSNSFNIPGGAGVEATDVAGFFVGDAANVVIVTAGTFAFAPDPSGLALSGDGHSIVLAEELSGSASVSASANSLLDMFFEVATSASYQFSASAFWNQDAPLFAGFSRIQVFDDTNSILLAEVSRASDSPGITNFGTTIALVTGTSYRILAESQINGSSTSAASLALTETEWEFSLRPAAVAGVPEASSGLTWTLGMVVAYLLMGASADRRNPIVA